MQENRIHITWYGTAAVRITAGSSQLLIDPFFPLPDSKVKIARNSYDGCRDIFISHGHFDHIGSISEIVQPDTVVYCTNAPYTSLCRKGVSKDNLHLIGAGDSFNIGDLRITAYKGSHIKLNVWDGLKVIFSKRVFRNRKGVIRKILTFTSCREKKESLCYLIEVYGKRILVLGSLALAEGVDYPSGVDLVLFPFQGPEQIYDNACDIYNKLSPKALLLTHYDDTFPPFSSEFDTAEFEEYLKGRTTVYKLRQGGSMEL